MMRFSCRAAVAAVVGSIALAGMAGQAKAAGTDVTGWSQGNITTSATNISWFNAAGLDAAYTCSDANYGQGGTYMTGADIGTYGARSTYTSSCATGNTANAAGSVVTSTVTLRAATTQTFNIIAGRIASVRAAEARGHGGPVTMALSDDHNSGAIGLSSGGARLKGIGIWAQGAFVHVKSTAAASKFNGNVITGMVGVDYKLKNNVLIGLSGGYEDTNITTTFNNGNLDATGYLVAPYLSVRINDILSVDAAGGYGWLNYDMDRKDTVKSNLFKATSVNARRAFGNITVNADLKFSKKRLSKLLVNINGGAAYTREKKDAFTETNQSDSADTVAVAGQTSRLGQGFLGTRIGYNLGKVNPYLNLRGEWDFSKSAAPAVSSAQTKPADDDFGLKVGLGLNFNLSPRVSGTIQGDTTLLRKDYREYKGLARVRVEF